VNILLCFALISGTLSLDQLDEQIKEHQQELQETQQQLGDIRDRIDQLNKNEKSSLVRIEAFQEQIAVTRKYIGQLDAQLDSRASEIAKVTREAEQTSAKIAARKQDLARRLVYIYKYGLLLPIQAVLSADAVTDIQRKMLYMRWIARADKNTTEELAALQDQLSKQRTRLVAARSELERLKQDRLKKQKMLKNSCSSESALLKKVRTERSTKKGLEKELNNAMAQLQELITRLEHQRQEQIASREHHYLEMNKGHLPWPVHGKILARFGSRIHPLYKTKTNNRGIDIKTKPGTMALAIAKGKIAYADHFMGYGNMVIVDNNGGFYTLYANLGQITTTVGAEVISGSALGKTKEYLHFEIRKQGKPVDPLDWLAPQK